jgi:hypothetical protein
MNNKKLVAMKQHGVYRCHVNKEKMFVADITAPTVLRAKPFVPLTGMAADFPLFSTKK